MVTTNNKMQNSLRSTGVLALELQPPLLLEQSTRVAGVIQCMRERGLGYALLTADDRLTGIFTERDVFLAVIGHPETLSQPVSSCMTARPFCLGEDDPVWQAVVSMHRHGFRQVPVVDATGRAVACVRHKDIAEYLVSHFAEHVLNLPPDPEQHARLPEGG